jgi:hypothetical protein
VIAEVWFTRGDGWTTDDDAGVDALYWQKRDGSKAKEVSQAVYDRLEKLDPYWEASVTEQVCDYLAYNQDIENDPQRTTPPLVLARPSSLQPELVGNA